MFQYIKTLHLFFLLISPLYTYASRHIENTCYIQSKIIDISSGLASNNVLSIEQDSIGTIWVGTERGISRITENEVISYDSPEFRNKRIRFIVKDREGYIWTATSSGLFRYDYSSDTFLNIMVDGQPVITNTYDIGSDGIYFVSKKGIVKNSYGTCSPYLSRINQGFPKNIKHFRILDDSTGVISSDGNGIYIIGLQSGHIKKIRNFDSDSFVRDLCVDHNRRIWIAFYNKGLSCISADTGKTYAEFRESDAFLNGDIILCLYTKDNSIWVGTDGGGIYVINPDNFTANRLSEYLSCRIPKETDSASSLHFSDGKIWIGTVRHGVILLRQSCIRHFDKADFGFLSKRGANRSVVSCLCETPDGNIWIGTDGSGMTVYDPIADNFRVVEKLATEKITSIEYIDNRTILLSIYGKGIYKYNTITGTIEYIQIVNDEVNKSILQHDMIINLKRLDDSTIYVMANRIFTYDIASGKISDPGLDNISSGNNFWTAGSDNIRTICYDHYNIFTITNNKTEAKKIYHTGDGDINMARASGDSLWIIKTNSLSTMDLTSGKLSDIPFRYNGQLMSMEFDSQGNLWLMTDETIIRLDGTDPESYITFGAADGYEHNSFIEGTAINTKAGEIYAGGTSGLCGINPDAVEREIQDYDISVLGIGSSCPKFHRDTISGSMIANIRLPWNYRSVSYRLCLNQSDVLKKNKFRYIIDSPWHTDTLFSDCNLIMNQFLPGKYQVKISYLDQTDRWKDTGKYIQARISWPWWIWPILLLFISVTANTVIVHKRIQRHRVNITRAVTEESQSDNNAIETANCQDATDREFLEKLDMFIDSNISNDALNAQMIIDHMCMGRASFYKKVKDTIGAGIMEHITRKRMKIASDLLKDKNIPISEIALKVGYSDYPYFSRVFKQYFNVAPSIYRKQLISGSRPDSN